MSKRKNYDELNQKRVMSIPESAKDFDVPHKSDPNYICNKKQYKEIMELYMKKLGHYLITTGEEIVLPSRLGCVRVFRYNTDKVTRGLAEMGKTTRKFVDFNKTKKLQNQGINKTVNIDNKATYGYWFKVRWTRFTSANFKNKTMYSFNLVRTLIRDNGNPNKKNDLTLVKFFREKGWNMYADIPRIKNSNLKLK